MSAPDATSSALKRTPLYGLHAVIALYFSRRLHLNAVAAVLGSHVSLPPLVPLWLAMDYAVGRFLVGGNSWLANAGAFFLGKIVVAFIIAAVALMFARVSLSLVRRPKTPLAPGVAGVVEAAPVPEAAAA